MSQYHQDRRLIQERGGDWSVATYDDGTAEVKFTGAGADDLSAIRLALLGARQSPPLVLTSLVDQGTVYQGQWLGELADGRIVYIRYRWSRLAVDVFDTHGSIGQSIFCESIGAGAMDGSMSTAVMLSYVRSVLIPDGNLQRSLGL